MRGHSSADCFTDATGCSGYQIGSHLSLPLTARKASHHIATGAHKIAPTPIVFLKPLFPRHRDAVRRFRTREKFVGSVTASCSAGTLRNTWQPEPFGSPPSHRWNVAPPIKLAYRRLAFAIVYRLEFVFHTLRRVRFRTCDCACRKGHHRKREQALFRISILHNFRRC